MSEIQILSVPRPFLDDLAVAIRIPKNYSLDQSQFGSFVEQVARDKAKTMAIVTKFLPFSRVTVLFSS